MPELTDKRLAEIRARAEAATPGPWRAGQWSGEPVKHSYQVFCDSLELTPVQDAVTPQDAAFIAHARTDVPALVAEVEELRALRAHLRNAGIMRPENLGGLMREVRVRSHDARLQDALRAVTGEG